MAKKAKLPPALKVSHRFIIKEKKSVTRLLLNMNIAPIVHAGQRARLRTAKNIATCALTIKYTAWRKGERGRKPMSLKIDTGTGPALRQQCRIMIV
jgi:hypothetical protein